MATSAGAPATLSSATISPLDRDHNANCVSISLRRGTRRCSPSAARMASAPAAPTSSTVVRRPLAVRHKLIVSCVVVTRNSAFALKPSTCSFAGTAIVLAATAELRSHKRALSLCSARAIAYRPSGLNHKFSDSRSTGSGMSSPRSKFSMTTWEFRLRFQPTRCPDTPVDSSLRLRLQVPFNDSPINGDNCSRPMRISSFAADAGCSKTSSMVRPDGAINFMRMSSSRAWLTLTVSPTRFASSTRLTTTRRTSGVTSSADIVQGSRNSSD